MRGVMIWLLLRCNHPKTSMKLGFAKRLLFQRRPQKHKKQQKKSNNFSLLVWRQHAYKIITFTLACNTKHHPFLKVMNVIRMSIKIVCA